MTPHCSIVIPTLNRHQQVMRLVADMLDQTYTELEVVIVDQSDDVSPERIASDKVHYIALDRKSTPHARNVGVAEAKGGVVVFFDDDSEVKDRELIGKIMKFFSSELDYAGLALTVVDANAQLNRENQQTSKRIMTVSRTGKVYPYSRGEAQDVTAPRGGGMAFRKQWITRVGGFDERYVGNAMREETDFSLRVVRAGGKIRYVPDLRVVHLGMPSGGSRTQNRLQWYVDFFANELLFVLTHFSRGALPIFFLRKARPIISCMVWYGKCRPRWLIAPSKGFWQGFRRFRSGMKPYGF